MLRERPQTTDSWQAGTKVIDTAKGKVDVGMDLLGTSVQRFPNDKLQSPCCTQRRTALPDTGVLETCVSLLTGRKLRSRTLNSPLSTDVKATKSALLVSGGNRSLPYRAHLLGRNLAPATVNLRLSPLRKLARQMADNGLLGPAAAVAVGQAWGVMQEGVRAGNWLLLGQASKRDRAMLALLIGCGLRRAEVLRLNVQDLEQREGRWVVPDLVGKGNRIRTVSLPAAVKARVDIWLAAVEINEGRIFPPVNKGGRVTGAAIADEKAVWRVVLKYARATSLGKLSPRPAPDARKIMPQGGRGH